MNVSLDDSWDAYTDGIQVLENALLDSSLSDTELAAFVHKAKLIVRSYFRSSRPSLRVLGVDAQLIADLDTAMQQLLKLSMHPNSRGAYITVLDVLIPQIDAVTVARELRLSDHEYSTALTGTPILSDQEEQIYNLLSELVPSAARSYHQAIIDMHDENRISYRGPANELREALRETLDHLAPDIDVMAQDSFKLEEGQSTPTRRQKVRFILRARGLSRTDTKVPEDFAEAIEVKVAAVVSATYGRANEFSHVQTERVEVLRVKQYVDVVLSELLSLPLLNKVESNAPAKPV